MLLRLPLAAGRVHTLCIVGLFGSREPHLDSRRLFLLMECRATFVHLCCYRSTRKACAQSSGGSTCCIQWPPAWLGGLADQHVVGGGGRAGPNAQEGIECGVPG